MEAEVGHSGVAVDSGNPLLRAVYLRRLRLTRLLLEGGAYINESDSRGQTPLMVACRTQHADAQSAGRAKLVQFLLEKGADPNIQDKEGHSVLMHACREHAGPEVVSLLLAGGADVSLEDRSGTSALVYAVMAGDWPVLKLLLDTCKAKGKEVIIIATDKLPCRQLPAKQYLSIPPAAAAALDPTSSTAPASPSEIQLITSPRCPSSSVGPQRPVFSFKEVQSCGVSSHPCSPSRIRGLGQPAANGLLRLNSEPWLKIPASLLAQEPSGKHRPDLNRAEDPNPSVRVPILERDKAAGGDILKDFIKHSTQKISFPGLLLSHSASHPNLHSEILRTDSASSSSSSSSSSSGAKHHSTPLHTLASSSLHSIIQRRKLGADIYSSDPQLALDAQTAPADGRKPVPLLRSSRESLLSLGPGRRLLSGYERRGSAAFLLDQGSSQVRPRSLPPLTLNATNAPALSVCTFGSSFSEKESELKKFLPSAPPGHPRELSRRMVLRRHSMQTEQFKSTA